MIELNNRQVDEYGNVVFKIDDLFPLLMKGYDIKDFFVWDSPELQKFRQTCRRLDNDEFTLKTYETPTANLEDTFETYRNTWLIPERYQVLDIRVWLLEKCNTDEERKRVKQELEVFEKYELFDMLKSLVYLVDVFNKHKVVWGVGRGSSVSSYVLYIIGIHRVNSILYDLDFSEFLN